MAQTSIADFALRLGAGGARANQFKVRITGGLASGLGDDITFLCRSAQIPGFTVGEVAVPYRGRQIFLAGDRTYDAWTTTIFADAAWKMRGTIEAWQNAIQNLGAETSSAAPMPIDYYAQADVEQTDKNDAPIRTYKLMGLWPQTIDPMDLAYDTNDAVSEFGVTWRFNWATSGPLGATVGTA